MRRRFEQVDVFGAAAYRGNPLAVVVDGDGLSDAAMQEFANWTNLSETTFLLPPTDPAADYRVRIFTTTVELPFAGHPTLGSAHVWLAHGGAPHVDGEVVQQCGVGLVTIRRDGAGLAFAAPPLIRSGPVDDALRRRVDRVLGTEAVDVRWAANGPRWIAATLPDARSVLDLHPDFGGTTDLELGVVGPAPPGSDHDFEVRAFFPGANGMQEDPVTGSLNASLAQLLMAADPTLERYTARQGTALGRSGVVSVERGRDGTIWIGGRVTGCVSGTVEL